MDTPESTEADKRRSGDRTRLEGSVTVQFCEKDVVGSGQNVSEEGVFFEAEDALRVRVRVNADEEWRDAVVVRMQSMDQGRIGIAVRFV